MIVQTHNGSNDNNNKFYKKKHSVRLLRVIHPFDSCLFLLFAFCLLSLCAATSLPSSVSVGLDSAAGSHPSFTNNDAPSVSLDSISNKDKDVKFYQYDDEDYNSNGSFRFSGLGRDFEHVFDIPNPLLRGGDYNNDNNNKNNEETLASSKLFISADAIPNTSSTTSSSSSSTTRSNRNSSSKARTYRRYAGRTTSSGSSSNTSSSSSQNAAKKRSFRPSFGSISSSRSRVTPQQQGNFLNSAMEWIQTVNFPQVQVRAEPTTTLKLRKRFPFFKTVATLGADCNLQLGVWQFRSSWEDSIVGGSLTLAGRELQFNKAWLLSMGVGDLATRLRLRAAVDLGTFKAYIRFGFRSERLSPINLTEGFTVMKQLPLDGQQGHVKLEFKANVSLPQPEIEFSTETRKGSLFSGVGMGDVEVTIEELNLLLDY